MATLNTASTGHRHFSGQARYHVWATHHRGQITAALTHLGHDCPELDMVYFLQAEQAPKT
jgi:hypothetical protein